MKKIWIFLFILIIIILIIFFLTTNSNKSSQNNTMSNDSSSDTSYNTEKTKSNVSSPTLQNSNQQIEEEIASFSTNIHNKDPERQNNITITCNTLNNTLVKPGETFSFCDTVGKATSSKGYQQADILVNGKVKQGLGRWQLSSKFYII